MHPIIAYEATKERLADWHQKAERGRRKHNRRFALTNLATVLASRVHAALTPRGRRQASLRLASGHGHDLTNRLSVPAAFGRCCLMHQLSSETPTQSGCDAGAATRPGPVHEQIRPTSGGNVMAINADKLQEFLGQFIADLDE